MDELNQLISSYHSRGLTVNEILNHLQERNDVIISKRSLERRLSQLGLFRRRNFSSIEEVTAFIRNQLSCSGILHGYRWMHVKCTLSGLTVTRKNVATIMKNLDPEGVIHRRRRRLRRRTYYNRGPDWLWHIDGYDKIKRFGIAISGCIDGYSRLLIWLRAGSTNNDPFVVAGYFMDAVRQVKGVPQTLRTDRGTENTHIQRIQNNLRHGYSTSGRPAFLESRSTGNQRIESWWSMLRKENSQYWIDLFKTIEDEGFFNGSYLDLNLVRFFFLPLIQEELNQVADVWHYHTIRRSRGAITPSGKPINLYFTPGQYQTRCYLVPVPEYEINNWLATCSFEQMPCTDVDIANLATGIMQRHNIVASNNVNDVITQYIFVRNEIMNSANPN